MDCLDADRPQEIAGTVIARKYQKPKFKQLPLPRSARLSGELDARVEDYLEKNGLSFNLLVRMALEQFISKTQHLELKPVPDDTIRITLRSIREKKAGKTG